jgi:hypothetical protein
LHKTDVDEKEFENFVEVMTVVALRKTEFFNKIWVVLEKKIPEDFTDKDEDNLRRAIIRTISEMTIKLFISEEEICNKKINSFLRLPDLHINEKDLVKQFYDSLHEQYPDLKI